MASRIERLHAHGDNAGVLLYAFDLLAIDSGDIRRERLDERGVELSRLLARPDGIRFLGSSRRRGRAYELS
jgi:ATP-dependent DNA ligase